MSGITRRGAIAGALALAAPAGATTILARPGRDGLYRFPGERAPIVDFRARIDRPVVLRAAEIRTLGGVDQFVRAVADDGRDGVCMGNSRLEEVVSLFRLAVLPAFIGKDLRDLEALVQGVYRAQYKFAGLAFWTAVGHLELAIWDLLGKAAGLRCAELMGPIVQTAIPIYASSLSRKTTPEEEAEALAAAAAALGTRAVKFKVGGRLSYNEDAFPGRTEKLVPLLRKRLGDDFTLYADANGSYDAPRALEVAALLADYGVAIFEEPCPHEDPEMTQQVAERAKIAIAGGEQDGRMEQWRWYLENRGLDVLQPDFMYNGGMLRTLMVQRMAAAAGVGIAPHYPQSGPASVQLAHFGAYAPNLHGFQEYRAQPHKHGFEHEPKFAAEDGKLTLPPGAGWGITYDPGIWNRGERLA